MPDTHSNLEQLLSVWRRDLEISPNIITWSTLPQRNASYQELPTDLHPQLIQALQRSEIFALYEHQAQTLTYARHGQNIVISTSTASGKSLAYNLPILDTFFKNPETCALYLFPTKALTHDQYQNIKSFLHEPSLAQTCVVYDGDTPSNVRSAYRKQAHLLLTNPDMLHTAILPHHTQWAHFFQNLRFVVLDEIHTYRGIFGSHVANIIRRLKRIANFYGAHPQFIMTSATIANPQELAEDLGEVPFISITQDGSPHGEQHFLIYNPPITNSDLGIRRSAMAESIDLAKDLFQHNIQSILFTRSRRSVETTLVELRAKTNDHKQALRGYRSGYLASERREIETGLRNNTVRIVIATNALELGIDIGQLEAAILVGYPGSIAALNQQAGRAGRRANTSLALFIASSDPLDQFLVHNPDYLQTHSPEKALIAPNNPLILLDHIRCAAFELPFAPTESFGSIPPHILIEYLQVLSDMNVLIQSGNKFFWIAEQYPAQNVSLRSATGQKILLQTTINDKRVTIGEIDYNSSLWMTHPGAIYMHEGDIYQTLDLDLEQGIANLHPSQTDYFTEPIRETNIQPIATLRSESVQTGEKFFGEISVTERVTGYRKILWQTRQMLAIEPLEMPETRLNTTAYWLTIGPEAIEILQQLNLWNAASNNYGSDWPHIRAQIRQRDKFRCQICGAHEKDRAFAVHHKIPFRLFTSRNQANHPDNLITLCPSCHRRAETVVRVRSGLDGLGYTFAALAPLFLMCDSHDIHTHTDPESPLANHQPILLIYDQTPAGIGLSEAIYTMHQQILAAALHLVESCPCKNGCPSCVGPTSESGFGNKEQTLALLQVLNGKINSPCQH
jgi:DEAD/DEAH box helicase domain-containing protein